jgi:hypothetical protein
LASFYKLAVVGVSSGYIVGLEMPAKFYSSLAGLEQFIVA